MKEIALDKDMEEYPKLNGNRFRICANSLFLTYPKMPRNLDSPVKQREKMEDMLKKIKDHFKEYLDQCIIAWEHHKPIGVNDNSPGDPHVHVVIKLKKNPKEKKGQWSFSGQKALNLFDSFAGQHGDYKTARCYQKSVLYLTKEGNYIVYNIDIDALKKTSSSKKGYSYEQVALKIRDEEYGVQQILDEMPGFLLQHQKKVYDFIDVVEKYKNKPKEDWIPLVAKFGRPIAEHQIVNWINNNIRVDRPHKKKQLWIYGATGLGKSYLWSQILLPMLDIYIAPYDSDWFDDYTNKEDLIVFDEYHGQYKVHFMNSFVEGLPFKLRRRNLGPITKYNNTPVIVISNKCIDEVYHKCKESSPHTFEAFKGRFIEVEVQSPMLIEPPKQPVLDIYTSEELALANEVVEGEVRSLKRQKVDLGLRNTVLNLTNDEQSSTEILEHSASTTEIVEHTNIRNQILLDILESSDDDGSGDESLSSYDDDDSEYTKMLKLSNLKMSQDRLNKK